MGANNSSQKETTVVEDESLTQEERLKLQSIYKAGVGGKDEKQTLSEDQLKSLWKGRVEDNLLERIVKYLFSNQEGSPSKKGGVTFYQFSHLFVEAVRGPVEEKAVLVASLTSGKSDGASTTDIIEYLKEIVASYVNAEKITKQFQSWEQVGCKLSPESVDLLATSLAHGLASPGKLRKETWALQDEERDCSVDDIKNWLMTCCDFNNMQTAVFQRLYFGADTPTGDDVICLFPTCSGVTRGILDDTIFPSELDMAAVAFLNSALPSEARNEWRFLFSSSVHGESFSKMLGNVLAKGATLIIVKDKDGHVFGGFATESWNLKPQFVGSENCFLFNLRPKMNIYYPTGYNDHFQYLNVQQQTMPNGLGMGGVMEYFGLFLDSSYGTGKCGETCTTYQSPLMSGNKEFEIAHLEVWGVGPPPKTPSELGERPSILDFDNEAKAVLAMAGKGGHSDGWRDPDESPLLPQSTTISRKKT
ncbi:hypothetical protein B566_EDAN014909 [Ephemera danica]|nr:hypothetical protein B566_EDAN014909 [Ephemera danica]